MMGRLAIPQSSAFDWHITSISLSPSLQFPWWLVGPVCESCCYFPEEPYIYTPTACSMSGRECQRKVCWFSERGVIKLSQQCMWLILYVTQCCGPSSCPCFPTGGNQLGTTVYEELFWRAHYSFLLSLTLWSQLHPSPYLLPQGHGQYMWDIWTWSCYFKVVYHKQAAVWILASSWKGD